MRRRIAALAFVALTAVASPASARRKPQPTPSPIPTATPSPLPTQPSEAVRFAKLHRDIAAISAAAPGRLGIAVVDLAQFTRFTARADEAFPLASVAKIPIALVAFRRADQHTFDLDRRIEIEPADLRRAVSPIADQHPHGGATYTYAELLRAMLIDNDSTATDLVLHAIGGPKAVDAFLAHAGIVGFDIRKTESDLFADAMARRTFATGADNSATPNAVASVLIGIANQQYLRFDSNNELLTLFGDVRTGRNRLAAGFPANAKFAHKIGTSETLGGNADATNDAGILTLPEGRRVIVVAFLAESKADLATREATLAAVGRAVYAAFVP